MMTLRIREVVSEGLTMLVFRRQCRDECLVAAKRIYKTRSPTLCTNIFASKKVIRLLSLDVFSFVQVSLCILWNAMDPCGDMRRCYYLA